MYFTYVVGGTNQSRTRSLHADIDKTSLHIISTASDSIPAILHLVGLLEGVGAPEPKTHPHGPLFLSVVLIHFNADSCLSRSGRTTGERDLKGRYVVCVHAAGTMTVQVSEQRELDKNAAPTDTHHG